MSEKKSRSSLRAVEFTACATVLAILASAGAPAPSSELIARNQRAAVETLRTIAAAQARLRSLTAIDTDCDGRGEYGYFGELAGAVPMRVSNNCVPGAGTPADILNPPLLPSDFGQVGFRGVRHEGYHFQIWLPNATAAGQVPGIAEAYTGGSSATFPNANNSERLWNCYAWPVDYGRTGNWAFFINQHGIVFKYSNGSITPYDGLIMTPGFSEAYAIASDMSSSIRIGEAGGANNTIWTPLEPLSWERISANQLAAISTLRSIAAAQAAFQSAGEIDTNCDGVGEYGYFAELAGAKPMRVSNNCEPAAGTQADILSPPLLGDALGQVMGSVVVHQGYVFQMSLPVVRDDGTVGVYWEHTQGGAHQGPFPDPIAGARMWFCCAWPLDYGLTGNRAYFVNQRGIVLEWQNRDLDPHEGMVRPLMPHSPYSDPEDLSSPLRIGVPGAWDGSIWTPVGP